MNKLALFLSVLSLSAHALPTETVQAQLSAGTLTVTGGAGVGYATNMGLITRIAPQVEYFLLDRVSVGGLASVDTRFKRGTTYLSAGPSATVHFLNWERLSAYLNAAYELALVTPAGESASS